MTGPCPPAHRGLVIDITKPFQQEEVLARVTTHLRAQRLTRELCAFDTQM